HPVQSPAQVGQVDFAVLPLAEGADVHRELPLGDEVRDILVLVERPDPPRAVVPEDVLALECGLYGAAIDVAASDGAADRSPAAMRVDRDGRRLAGGVAAGRVVAAEALHHVPAVVLTSNSGRGAVDLLVRTLAHVADVKVLPLAIEAVAPGVPQPPRPDLLRAAARGKGVAGWDGVWLDAVDVDAQDLAEQAVLVLPIPERVASATAVAGGDVEVAIGPEGNPAAVVVGIGPMTDAQQHTLRR